MAILDMNAKRQGYAIAQEAKTVVRGMLAGMSVSDRLDFGNARGMRNTLEKLVQEQANRLAGETGEITREMLCEISAADAKAAMGEEAQEEAVQTELAAEKTEEQN